MFTFSESDCCITTEDDSFSYYIIYSWRNILANSVLFKRPAPNFTSFKCDTENFLNGFLSDIF